MKAKVLKLNSMGDNEGYVPIDDAPEDVDLPVRWGDEYGTARLVLDRWFKRDYGNSFADRRPCATPDAYYRNVN